MAIFLAAQSPTDGIALLLPALAGMLAGLIPLWLGHIRGRVLLGWIGFGLCTIAGILFGLKGALAVAGVAGLAIYALGNRRGV